MRYFILLLLVLCSKPVLSQELTATEVLDKSIEFHDPNGQWKQFNGSFEIIMETPNSSDRLSTIALNIPKEQFTLAVSKDDTNYAYSFDKQNCTITLNGSSEISDKDKEELRLNCDRGLMMRNYYTYLYGLPMKMKDPGAHLDPKVDKKTFKGKEYLVLKITYDENVGKDVWYFYFDPATYAMEVYQFYHDEQKGDGEYILLEGLEEIHGVKIPKTRAWYYNKDDKYLGTDVLKASR